MSKLALLGGKKTVKTSAGDAFKWPIVNAEMERNVLRVLRDGNMSGTDVTKEFEKKFAQWHGMKYGLGCNTGTAALQCAMFAMGVGAGDEVIAPSITYWATCLPALSLGASVVFADIDPDTLCIDPKDIEKRITRRTKLIIPVHYLGYPADMKAIMKIARKHKIKVLEDVSHAHGGLCDGKMVGTMGDAAGFSLMTGKSFAIGEGGILLTNKKAIYERAIMFGHYARHGVVTDSELKKGAGLPWGGYKYRMHQLSAVAGLAQLKKYPKEMKEIDDAMNYFWDQLEGLPGIKAHRPPAKSQSTMGGWYACHGLYRPEELEGLSLARFAEAVNAEGGKCGPGCNSALHMHPVFNEVDVYHQGRPTNLANIPKREARRPDSIRLPVSEGIQSRVYYIPWFKKLRKKFIKEHASAYRKVVENYADLLPGDKKTAKGEPGGRWGLTARRD